MTHAQFAIQAKRMHSASRATARDEFCPKRQIHRVCLTRRTAAVGVWCDVCALHHDSVWSDDGGFANIHTVEHDCLLADACATADAQAIDLENAIFETVCLKLTRNCGVIFKREHVGIDELREARAEYDALADVRARESKVCVEEQRALQRCECASTPVSPHDVQEIPSRTPA